MSDFSRARLQNPVWHELEADGRHVRQALASLGAQRSSHLMATDSLIAYTTRRSRSSFPSPRLITRRANLATGLNVVAAAEEGAKPALSKC